MDLEQAYREAREGDSESEDRLFSALAVRFRLFAKQRVGRTEDAEDIAQRSLEVVFRKYRQVEIKQSFAAWAHKVLKNEVLRHYRDEKREQERFDFLGDFGGFPDQRSADPLLRRRILDCLRKLARRNRRYAKVVLMLRQGYDTDKLCKSLNVNQSNLYVLLGRARRALSACLEDDGDL